MATLTEPLAGKTDALGRRGKTLLIIIAILVAVFAAYRNSLHVPLLLDDERAIATNASIRHLADLGAVLSPPKDSGPSGRPVLNLSFALNYAIGGENVFGYHVVNVLIHALAGLALFGVMRRTLLRVGYGGQAPGLAFFIALLWLLHPLQTASVTYLSERAEELMGLFYLLTLYGLLRGAEATSVSATTGASTRWLIFSVACCWLGMATKEVMVTAPVVVFLFDAIFVAGTARNAWRARWKFHASLAASWLLLAWLMLSLGRHAIGFDRGIGPWEYLLTECNAIARYVGLVLWPHGLVFDYGAQFVRDPLSVVPAASLVLALLGGTAWLLRRAPAAGFSGLVFFILLAPTSSVVPVVLQPVAENRLYLPLAAIVAGLVLAAHRLLRTHTCWLALSLALAAFALTVDRNADYRDALTLWTDTVVKRPDNPRAHDHLGNALAHAGRLEEAVAQYRVGVQLAPEEARIHYNLAKALHDQGHADEAIREYETSLRLDPAYAEAQINLAAVLAESGRDGRAAELAQSALQRNPNDASAHYNAGLIAFHRGQLDAAVGEFQRALVLDSAMTDARDMLATALFRLGRADEAIRQYEEILRVKPDAVTTQHNLGNALFALGRIGDAKAHFERALQLRPDYGQAHTSLGVLYLQSGDPSKARGEFETALRLDPKDAEAHFRFGMLLAMSGDIANAATHWQETVRLRPDDAEAHNNLGLALAQTGRPSEAIRHFEEALRLKPDYDRARNNLAELQAQQNASAARK